MYVSAFCVLEGVVCHVCYIEVCVIILCSCWSHVVFTMEPRSVQSCGVHCAALLCSLCSPAVFTVQSRGVHCSVLLCSLFRPTVFTVQSCCVHCRVMSCVHRAVRPAVVFTEKSFCELCVPPAACSRRPHCSAAGAGRSTFSVTLGTENDIP